MTFKLPNVRFSSRTAYFILFGSGIAVGALVAFLATLITLTPPGWDLVNPFIKKGPPEIIIPPPLQETSIVSPEDRTKPRIVVDERSMRIQVDWKTPRILSRNEIWDLFIGMTTDTNALEDAFERESIQTLQPGMSDESGGGGMWLAGTVNNGEWKGSPLYILRLLEEGLGVWRKHVYVVRPNGSQTLYAVALALPSDDSGLYVYQQNPLLQIPVHLPNATIEGISASAALTLQSGEKIVSNTGEYGGSKYRVIDIDPTLDEVAKTREGFTAYTHPIFSDCLLVFMPDGSAVHYKTEIPRRDTNDYERYPYITWKPGYSNTDGYMDKQYGGCGPTGCVDLVSEEVLQAEGDLIVVGVTSEGDEIFAPKDPTSAPSIKTAYDSWYDPSWGSSYLWDGPVITSEFKPDIKEFLKQHPVPVFFWKDPLGRWIKHSNQAIQSPAECGKPVIYLYPEQTTDVRVKLPSFINVTVSDPAYPSEGWRVTAQPNGQLTDKRDGKQYGSLYWEGTGVGYATPKDGWVVKDGDVEQFLADVLPRYGLNETEAREFMEFWVPEMKGAPYYRVSFLTSAWSSAAPIFVSPRPTTNIRLFMDWRPLAAPIDLAAPEIVTPEREGFTLVEWGGTLYR